MQALLIVTLTVVVLAIVVLAIWLANRSSARHHAETMNAIQDLREEIEHERFLRDQPHHEFFADSEPYGAGETGRHHLTEQFPRIQEDDEYESIQGHVAWPEVDQQITEQYDRTAAQEDA